MDYITRVEKFMSRQKWIRPAGLTFVFTLLVAGIVLLFVHRFDGMKPGWIFTCGADVFCLAITGMISLSCFRNSTENAYNRIFFSLLNLIAAALFLDECSWLVDGIQELKWLNLTVNVLYYVNGALLVNAFWHYCVLSLDINKKLLKVASIFIEFGLIPTIILCFVNFFYPLYFFIDENAAYVRSDLYLISQIYIGVALIFMILAFIFSKAPVRTRLICSSFVTMPLICQVLSIFSYGLSLQYAGALVAIVLIYAALFADRERTLASTEKELFLAQKIQSEMLPNIFPAFPTRKDFDIYALMDPAKEVGGDFYDFFFIDQSHLALVIADVSGKGVPAALFMMASKIILQEFALTGANPALILEKANDQICQKNPEEMFVTTWLGILDLETGALVAANAGHEYPLVQEPNGKFEILKDKHGFVLGGFPNLKYTQYTIQMKPGSKLFVYTDGVAEAKNIKGKQFSFERACEVLNENTSATPKELIERVRSSIEGFVQEADQFDDITMLCVQYNGGGVKA